MNEKNVRSSAVETFSSGNGVRLLSRMVGNPEKRDSVEWLQRAGEGETERSTSTIEKTDSALRPIWRCLGFHSG